MPHTQPPPTNSRASCTKLSLAAPLPFAQCLHLANFLSTDDDILLPQLYFHPLLSHPTHLDCYPFFHQLLLQPSQNDPRFFDTVPQFLCFAVLLKMRNPGNRFLNAFAARDVGYPGVRTSCTHPSSQRLWATQYACQRAGAHMLTHPAVTCNSFGNTASCTCPGGFIWVFPLNPTLLHTVGLC